MTDPIIISYSEIDTYRQCPLKHQLAYKQRWTKPMLPGDRRGLGGTWHRVAEIHYGVIKAEQKKRKGRFVPAAQIAPTTRRAAKAVRKFLDSHPNQEEAALVWWMYEGHVEAYGLDEQWVILGIEARMQVPMLKPDGTPSRFHLKGVLDLVVRDVETGGLWVIDHKSGANLPSQMDLEIDDQFGLYQWMLAAQGHRALGSIHSAIRTKRNLADYPDYTGKATPQTLEQRLRRTYLNRSDTELRTLALDAWAVAENAYPEPGRELPKYSSPDPRQCGWKCDFKEAHIAIRTGTPPEHALEDFGFVQDFTRH